MKDKVISAFIEDNFYKTTYESGRKIQIWMTHQQMMLFDKALKEEFYKQFPTCGQQYEKQNNIDEELS